MMGLSAEIIELMVMPMPASVILERSSQSLHNTVPLALCFLLLLRPLHLFCIADHLF